jgi:hypothetical protein
MTRREWPAPIAATPLLNADTPPAPVASVSIRGAKPFPHAVNIMLLAEANGVGSTDLKRSDVRGVPIAQVIYRCEA